jgi:hypothetical protein
MHTEFTVINSKIEDRRYCDHADNFAAVKKKKKAMHAIVSISVTQTNAAVLFTLSQHLVENRPVRTSQILLLYF